MDIKSTLECGQIFRYRKAADGYTVLAGDKCAFCRQRGETAFIETADEDFFYSFFDGGTDYEKVQAALSHDPYLKRIMPKYKGLRLLRQDLWEMIVSFIVSQNNHIPRIQKIIEGLCAQYGANMGGYFGFPSAQALAKLCKEDLAPLKCGYRDSYIIDAAQKFAAGEVSVEKILHGTLAEARTELEQINGVGPKVADCILLFGAGRRNTFPVDTWMKKVLSQIYKFEDWSPKGVRSFAEAMFGAYSGYAQQYLFYASRCGDIFQNGLDK